MPRDVMQKGAPLDTQVTIINARLLYKLIEWWQPELLEFKVDWLAPQDAWVYLVLPDGELIIRRARLSLDGRWTLSPVY
jgi:hypothetical protein